MMGFPSLDGVIFHNEFYAQILARDIENKLLYIEQTKCLLKILKKNLSELKPAERYSLKTRKVTMVQSCPAQNDNCDLKSNISQILDIKLAVDVIAESFARAIQNFETRLPQEIELVKKKIANLTHKYTAYLEKYNKDSKMDSEQ
jgi:hypothetical protein